MRLKLKFLSNNEDLHEHLCGPAGGLCLLHGCVFLGLGVNDMLEVIDMMYVRSIIDTYKGHDRQYGHDRHFGCDPHGGYDGHGCQTIHGGDS